MCVSGLKHEPSDVYQQSARLDDAIRVAEDSKEYQFGQLFVVVVVVDVLYFQTKGVTFRARFKFFSQNRKQLTVA